MEFYHERRGLLAWYGIEASSPEAAVLAGRSKVVAEHPSPSVRRRRLSLFERAQGAGGQDDSGWVLYRLGQESAGS